MAKALYGHLTAADPRLVAEVARLRRRVAELEAQNALLRSELLDPPDDRSSRSPLDLLIEASEPVSV